MKFDRINFKLTVDGSQSSGGDDDGDSVVIASRTL